VELFSPQSIPRVAPNDRNEPVFSAQQGNPLPWEPGHSLKARCPPAWTARRHHVYCGVYSLEKVRTILEDKLGKDAESFDERSDGEGCVFAFSVTDNGRPLFDTFVVSTCAWATSRTIHPGPESAVWLDGFDAKSSDLAAGFAERLSVRARDKRGQELKEKGFHLGRAILYSDIVREAKRIARELEVTSFADALQIRVKTVLVASRKQYSADDQDFLNSFFVKDLGKVARELREKNIGKGLYDFLTSDDRLDLSRRIDVRKSIPTLFQQLAPALFPLGRWPSKGHHPLVFSQQLAVNSAVNDLRQGGGLSAVNGPPGSGKTTLLRDLTAAVVVDRAMRLSELQRPEYAFAGERRWKSNGYNRVISVWKDELKGFEIVVASSNNGAVENVTLEIPGIGAVDPSWLGEADYFPDFASRLIGQPAWAMVAARLGNKANRNEFLNRFWYGDKEADGSNDEDASSAGFLKLLKSLEAEPADWPQAVARFKKVVADERGLRDERVRTYDAYLQSQGLMHDIPTLQSILQVLAGDREKVLQRIQDARPAENVASVEVNAAKNRRLEHRRLRPGFWEVIFSFGKAFMEWREKDKVLAAFAHEAEGRQNLAANGIALLQRESAKIEQEEQHVSVQLEAKRRLASALEAQLSIAAGRLGCHFPNPNSWNDREELRELSSPWADREWNDARARVFLEALRLHKAFITASADRMRKSLMGAMDVLSGAVPDSAPADAVEAAWTTLFFVIPVISTTFASFDRLFSHLGREKIGWLLIDEAGQAVPQAAVGAIWRSKRTVVVGDPMQLEPIVTLPFTAQQALRRTRVEETWLPGTTSVQGLADRVSGLGTFLNGLDKPIWVGAPLRVHRRCDQPMFDISNHVAYDGMMVFGTPSRSQVQLPPSEWIDVVGNESDGHWIPAEGQKVEELLGHLFSQGVTPGDVFLISPFRVVAGQLRHIAKHFEGLSVGTIHTVQGKESDIVFLVLGGDPMKPGAKQWASARPNLANVAASRAKRRLYVVGNRDAWKQYPYFNTIERLLSKHAS